jgi:hypothetical protein
VKRESPEARERWLAERGRKLRSIVRKHVEFYTELYEAFKSM